jgi:hypothetical protein
MWGNEFKKEVENVKNILRWPFSGFREELEKIKEPQQRLDITIKLLLPRGSNLIHINNINYKIIVDTYSFLQNIYRNLLPPFFETKEQKKKREKYCKEIDEKVKSMYKDVKKGLFSKPKKEEDLKRLFYEFKIRGYKVAEEDFDHFPIYFDPIPNNMKEQVIKNYEVPTTPDSKMFFVLSPVGTTKKQRKYQFKRMTRNSGLNFGGLNAYCEYCREYGAKKRCSRCHDVYYCNKKCQTKHWKSNHKKECTK